MRPRRALNRLRLGPVVGHTDDTSAKVWIQVADDPVGLQTARGRCRLVRFLSTEPAGLEFGTAIARALGCDRI